MPKWKYQTEFSRVKLNHEFVNNGNKYNKTSVRTGHLIEYNRSFYFSKNELVLIEGRGSLANEAIVTG